jgi:ATP-dependent Clp protease adaptor protein ClpS
MAERRDDSGTGVITRTRTETERKLKKPPLYKVLLHNDDYTTREFVVEILRAIFHKPEPDAVRIMLHVHQNGVGVAGVYTFEVAEMKVRQVEALAREREFPLMLSIEPEE